MFRNYLSAASTTSTPITIPVAGMLYVVLLKSFSSSVLLEAVVEEVSSKDLGFDLTLKDIHIMVFYAL